MRLQFLLSLVTFATAVVGAPPHDRAPNDALEARSPDDLAALPHIQKRDPALPRDLTTLAPRRVGTLGKGAFAGKGAGKARITALQYLLLDHKKIGVDGLWGPETAGAVKAAQEKFGLEADSIPGPATLGALANQIKRGAKGNVVKAAQAALNGKGASLEVDGQFGSGTHGAVEKFQKDNNLDADGIVGKLTWTALFGGRGGGGTPGGDAPDGNAPGGDPNTKPLSIGTFEEWTTYALYASIAKCDMSAIHEWDCGKCRMISEQGGKPIVRHAQQNGRSDLGPHQNFYAVERNRRLTIAIEGALVKTYEHYLDQDLVPAKGIVSGVPDNAKIREGHLNLAKIIKTILEGAVKVSVDNGIDTIAVVGHSQGGSVAEILGASYQADYPSLTVYVRAFNPPKSGNREWAEHVERELGGEQFRYAVYQNDDTVHDPGSPFTHPIGEVFLPVGVKDSVNGWVECNGRQNTACSAGVTEGRKGASDGSPHGGPFMGVMLKCAN